jgi:nicotinate-nucleotide pyrophosphorylase (carboxylating)
MVLPLDLVRSLIDAALAEDVGSGDATTLATVGAGALGEGIIVAKEAGVICGLPVAREVFVRVDPALSFEADHEDGDPVAVGAVVARVRGPARGILTAERTALNFLQHLSGIATGVRRVVDLLEGTGTRILDTRKTVPGMRMLSKYAVRCGGGENHRQGLYDMILIKENHITAAGGVAKAVSRSRDQYPSLAVEVEVTDLDELEEALAAKPDRILLDNFDPGTLESAVERIRGGVKSEQGKVPEVELSGGITLKNVRTFAFPGVDYISSGSLTHSVTALDLSLDFELVPAGKTADRKGDRG